MPGYVNFITSALPSFRKVGHTSPTYKFLNFRRKKSEVIVATFPLICSGYSPQQITQQKSIQRLLEKVIKACNKMPMVGGWLCLLTTRHHRLVQPDPPHLKPQHFSDHFTKDRKERGEEEERNPSTNS